MDFLSKKIGVYTGQLDIVEYQKIAIGLSFADVYQLITKHGYWNEIFGCWVVGLLRPRYDLTLD